MRSRRSRQRPSEPSREQPELAWRKMDLHIHTPASSDYQQPQVTFIDILRRAEEVGLDILAFTDHNSVRGFARMWREIEDLELLEALGRISPSEAELLAEYRRLLNRILLLPGFEFTATFGFHILAIFPPETSIRKLEQTLLALNIAEEKLDQGTSEVGATTEVREAYELMHGAGAMVIPAHVNSTHGVAMQGFPFGGQTKIAYTQSEEIHALEATDLESGGSRSTARFFNGSKTEYPRRMHVIQGSDAHRLLRESERSKDLGVGDRVTEVALPVLSFEALRAVFEGNDFSVVRPFTGSEGKLAQALGAREQGATQTQAFHASLGKSRRKTNTLFKDVVAFANGEGGTIYVGMDATAGGAVTGVPRAKVMAEQVREDLARFIAPAPVATVEVLSAHDHDLLTVTIASGPDKPYAIADGEIYIREGGESLVANRDQIVELVRRALLPAATAQPEPIEPEAEPEPLAVLAERTASDEVPLPRSGFEVLGAVERDGATHYTLLDLRERKLLEDVTAENARRLESYAIRQSQSGTPERAAVKWEGPFGVIRRRKERNGNVRYDLAYQHNGDLRVFYNVAAGSLGKEWRAAVQALSPTTSGGNGNGNGNGNGAGAGR
ncbi:MAG TPA: RNA-binding domain-containing protein [Nitrolancea sp.]|nr:RNA-binding domain-containing protein [Nitrolancea sp.]